MNLINLLVKTDEREEKRCSGRMEILRGGFFMFTCEFSNLRRLRNNNEAMRTKHIDQCLVIQERKSIEMKWRHPSTLSLSLGRKYEILSSLRSARNCRKYLHIFSCRN